MELECCEKRTKAAGIDVEEMMVLAASLDDCQEIEHGDVIWAKLLLTARAGQGSEDGNYNCRHILKIPSTLAPIDVVERYSQVTVNPLHRTNKPGILFLDIQYSESNLIAVVATWLWEAQT